MDLLARGRFDSVSGQMTELSQNFTLTCTTICYALQTRNDLVVVFHQKYRNYDYLFFHIVTYF